MNTIGEKTVARIVDDIQGMLETYLQDINRVFEEGDGMSISMSAKLNETGNGNVNIITRLKFKTGEISDSYESSVNERQEELPFPDKEVLPIDE